jgi:hypothetical protein
MEQTLINGLPGNDYARARAGTQGKHAAKAQAIAFSSVAGHAASGTIGATKLPELQEMAGTAALRMNADLLVALGTAAKPAPFHLFDARS